MSKVKKYTLVIVILSLYISTGIIVGVVLREFLPQYYFPVYPIIPAYFTLLGFVMLWILLFTKGSSPAKVVNTYMMMRTVKLIITIGFILAYNMVTDDHRYPFTLITVAFYFFFLFVETYLFIKFEKERMKK
ncbi:MAG: hypothetical protein PHP30_03225 [Bacteroidales bacterium]|nr:hypothetical protein [Bacteroidales bacterium]MDD2424938.1 hypothetical protein [Bacteroidales bacterium]MDD3989090.1 hypothetical protein [Bacteroidales bacterium]MDD4638473.1 hypothetical protein [Bacteroidales bacterium]